MASVTLQQLGGIQYTISGEECAPRFEFRVPLDAGASAYSWSCSGPFNFNGCVENGNTANGFISEMLAFQTVQINVSVSVTNECGDEIIRSVSVTYSSGDCEIQSPSDDPRTLHISPNPTDTDFTVTISETDPSLIVDSYTVLLTDPYGETSILLNTPNKVFSVDAQNLMNGLYFCR